MIKQTVPDTWRLYTDGRLDQLKELKHGWYKPEAGEPGEPIHPRCLLLAHIFAYAVIENEGVRPYIYPTPDGGIQIEFESVPGSKEAPAEVVISPPVKL